MALPNNRVYRLTWHNVSSSNNVADDDDDDGGASQRSRSLTSIYGLVTQCNIGRETFAEHIIVAGKQQFNNNNSINYYSTHQ
jgi:hypothetical protein